MVWEITREGWQYTFSSGKKGVHLRENWCWLLFLCVFSSPFFLIEVTKHPLFSFTYLLSFSTVSHSIYVWKVNKQELRPSDNMNQECFTLSDMPDTRFFFSSISSACTDSFIHPDTLLVWCKKQVALYDSVTVDDMAASFKVGGVEWIGVVSISASTPSILHYLYSWCRLWWWIS